MNQTMTARQPTTAMEEYLFFLPTPEAALKLINPADCRFVQSRNERLAHNSALLSGLIESPEFLRSLFAVNGATGRAPALCCQLYGRKPRGREGASLGGDAEGGVGRAIAAIAAAALDDFEEEAFAEGRAVELEILAVLVAIVENVVGAAAGSEVASDPGRSGPRDRRSSSARSAAT